MASSVIKSGALVLLEDLHPSSPHFKQGTSLRVTGKYKVVKVEANDIEDGEGEMLQEYSVETAIAMVVDGSAKLKINTEHLRNLSLRIGSFYQFIGELLIQPDNEARVGRNVDGINLDLYRQSLQLLRQFQADHQ
ncbi:hypothetical protein F8388_009946 [Cannabis sativa]|uniref:CST complex subunit TEN1 n=1 Tax=Cannabis sativa TaxID=3483 RepID=A0A7J6ENH4_CANSA|nr:hypothetical protein G4B88_024253 [Cannabis sativa]KAF4389813.1 hypothetical protein F8388_009946 [Cannabis sativa]